MRDFFEKKRSRRPLPEGGSLETENKGHQDAEKQSRDEHWASTTQVQGGKGDDPGRK